jgi:hypothetical protein
MGGCSARIDMNIFKKTRAEVLDVLGVGHMLQKTAALQ